MEYTLPLTIITPSYNRGNYLKRLYDSLVNQNNHHFQWLIIDDGSTDDTERAVESFDNKLFALDYYKKKNGGKHTALNYSHPYIKGELVCIVDSDDWLLPEAVDKILERKREFFQSGNVKMLSFLRGKVLRSHCAKAFRKNRLYRIT